MIEISKTIHFAAAHRIEHEWAHTCRELHGHNYALTVTVKGEIGGINGAMDCVIPYDCLEASLRLALRLENTYLNDIIDYPTAERIAVWAWEKLQGKLPREVSLVSVKVQETPNSSAEYKGPQIHD